MNCAICQRPGTRIVATRTDAADNTIRRRRKCRFCGRTFSTTEALDRGLDQVSKAKRAVEATP